MTEYASGLAHVLHQLDELKDHLAERDRVIAQYEKHLANLMNDAAELQALRNFGVEDWEGYAEAMQSLEDKEGNEE